MLGRKKVKAAAHAYKFFPLLWRKFIASTSHPLHFLSGKSFFFRNLHNNKKKNEIERERGVDFNGTLFTINIYIKQISFSFVASLLHARRCVCKRHRNLKTISRKDWIFFFSSCSFFFIFEKKPTRVDETKGKISLSISNDSGIEIFFLFRISNKHTNTHANTVEKRSRMKISIFRERRRKSEREKRRRKVWKHKTKLT